MKNLNFKTVFTALLFFVCLSCNNNNDDNPSSPTTEGYYINVTIDGVDHSFEKSVFVNSSSLNIGLISILSNDGNGKNIGISISPDDLTATGTFSDEFNGVFLQDGLPGAWDSDGNSRTITILENNDDFIEGTFSFTGNNIIDDTIKEFTKGSFKARKL